MSTTNTNTITADIEDARSRLKERYDNNDIEDTETRYQCPECQRMVTLSPTKDIEYGHERGYKGNRERCSRRPTDVDPDRNIIWLKERDVEENE